MSKSSFLAVIERGWFVSLLDVSQPIELHCVFIVVESIDSKSGLAGAKDKLTYTLSERAKILVET